MNQFPKSETFPLNTVQSKIMGPNPLKLCEELLQEHEIPKDAVVLDLGSGTGITSCMLAREYGFITYAVDLWSDPGENMRFFEEMGLSNRQICPIKADATQGLPFATEFFDAVISIDSYNYFGRDSAYLGEKLLPHVKHDGLLYFAIPGMVKDCHDNLPCELLLSWTPEQLEYMHDMDWWRTMIEPTCGVHIESISSLSCHDEAWADWLTCENEYAAGDRASMEAGAGKLLNSIGIVLRKL
ncbi:cyclopropane-fatty-acyl-phospholipid synthase family protein [Adlercreutzia sp. ZJ154]|uniref:SAM-dependent methyltransferase n=1 Tax=Adlercreutzia sp. ZJ154 TaxID=2709790 RepID=UPI0013ECC93F|nr:class I SAM-dependent methyltransferase [Adlercreutzia sp. ZJ154]